MFYMPALKEWLLSVALEVRYTSINHIWFLFYEAPIGNNFSVCVNVSHYDYGYINLSLKIF